MACKAFTTPLQSLTTLQGTHNGQKFSSQDRLPAARQQEPGSFTSVSDVANPTSSEGPLRLEPKWLRQPQTN
eukprot:1716802-Amphidinium_carterae.1